MDGKSCSKYISTSYLKDGDFPHLGTLHKPFYIHILPKIFVSSSYVISCADQHLGLEASRSSSCIQNKYSEDPIHWYESATSYSYYKYEDHLTSKQNRECLASAIFFKTRLGTSSKIREEIL
jgi:hypothetical protein